MGKPPGGRPPFRESAHLSIILDIKERLIHVFALRIGCDEYVAPVSLKVIAVVGKLVPIGPDESSFSVLCCEPLLRILRTALLQSEKLFTGWG
jgi:hypothetical protein